MSQEKKTTAIITKSLVAGIVGFLAWTLSIHIIPVQLDAQPMHDLQCQKDETSSYIFQRMVDGIITQMHNDGRVLRIEISPAWKSLSHNSQRELYDSLGCFAHYENVAFQIQPSQDSTP